MAIKKQIKIINKMTISNFLNVLANTQHKFAIQWFKKQNEKDPEMFPLEMELEDWFDQYFAFLEQQKIPN